MTNKNTNQNCQLLTAKALGKMLSLSARTVWRLRSSGKLPAPVKVGGAIRWEQGIIEKWIRMGCPDCKEFETRKEAEQC